MYHILSTHCLGTLLISDAQEGDDASYSLKACNSISGIIHCTQSMAITLVVVLSPPAAQGLAILSENPNAHEVTIGWTNPATGLSTAPASYLLQLRTSLTDEFIDLDEEIPVGSYGGYTVTKLFPGYLNFFRILGSNLAGFGTPSNELNVTLPPGIPRIRKVSVKFLTSSSINVTFQLWHDGGEKLRELVVQYKVNSSSVWMEVRDSFFFKNVSYFAVVPNLKSSMYYDVSYKYLLASIHGRIEYVCYGPNCKQTKLLVYYLSKLLVYYLSKLLVYYLSKLLVYF